MSAEAIRRLLEERQQLFVSDELSAQLARYLELLLRWNARTNLSAVRSPEEIVLRHFGESLQCAELIPPGSRTLLDFGSGAGFPGMPCALACPFLAVTLAESQGKKAAFLQELSRTLRRPAAVYAGRVEAMPAAQRFDVVTMRAVDQMEHACREARQRARPGGRLILMTTEAVLAQDAIRKTLPALEIVRLRGTEQGVLALATPS